MGLHDVHAHLTDRRLLAREADVLANARAAGVTTIVSNGLNPSDNQAVAELAARSGGLVKPAFGLYPVDAILPELLALGVDYPREGTPADPEQAIEWLAEHLDGCVAVGEIGLDHHWVPEPLWALQEQRFRRIVRLAMDADLPIIIHTRNAEARALDVLIELGATRVSWHCFGGRVKLAQRIAAHGHWLSIPANARRSQSFTRMLEVLPRERILLETDCPYLGPDREALNEPANVAGTAAYAAELWGESIDAVNEKMNANFRALFRFDA
jgi:TatD DNase family protein